ncbi:nucleoside phosphorylase [Desulfococcaceae bacterium HSG7]|nr:nucleoside phosphorylase [Desulfococcaceae bacterium HSG7]
MNYNNLFDSDYAIVNPFKGKHAPDLGSVAVMVSAVSELHTIRRLIIPQTDNYRRLYTSRLYLKPQTDVTSPVAVVGPYIGAPYAVMLIETLIKWEADKIIVLGLCGSISTDVRIGDIVVPTSALVDEGVSKHYRHREDRPSYASESIVHHIKKGLIENGLTFHEGPVWTTDAIYRETVSAVKHFQQKNAIAVEMELSALFSVARFRGVEVGSILVVSDELASMRWKPGFKEACFKKTCHSVCTVISKLWNCI